MNNLDKQYQDLLKDILENGQKRMDRTGTGTLSVFGRQIRHKMSEGLPVLTTKKVYWKGVVEELLWFLRGETNIKPLVMKGVNIWVGDCYKRYKTNIERQREKQRSDVAKMRASGKMVKVAKIELVSEQEFIELIKSDEDFAQTYGELGPVYGAMWRKWPKKVVGKNVGQTTYGILGRNRSNRQPHKRPAHQPGQPTSHGHRMESSRGAECSSSTLSLWISMLHSRT